MNPQSQSQPHARPWWKFGYVWLLISGPAVVVVAGFATLWLALAYPETLVSDDPGRTSAQAGRRIAPQALTPALQARNHAATASPSLAR